jgi:hypothetical protein
MTRLLALGLLGLVLAVAVGLGIHAVTRETIALPVVRLEQGASLAPPTARVSVPTARTRRSTSDATTTTTAPAPTGPATTASTETTGEDDSGSSGSGRGRGRGRGGDDD